MFRILKALVYRNRTYRRFYENVRVSRAVLLELIDLARLSASGGNLQPLKYRMACTPSQNALVFSCLRWAGYLTNWGGPTAGERPSAYIVILGDKLISRNFGCDHGIAAQSIMLGATERGLGGCIIGSINRKRLQRALRIPSRLEILLVLALGKPREKVVLEQVRRGDIRYWRDSRERHHVPKRSLRSLVLGFR